MLFSRFENCLDRFLSSPTQVILAFSGGLDSRVMLDLLATYRDVHPQHNYLVVHVHHGLSPNADDWQKRCQAWATEAGFPFVCQRVNLELKGKSLEREAREARYKAISSLMEAGAVALTGQHADDQVETFMLALKRGSGPAGLASMPERRPMQSGWLLRPLLTVSRADIEDYGEEQGLSWLEDESNSDLRFDRNFLRHQWLPVARTRWPGMDKAIQRTAALCAEQESLLDEVLSQFDNALFADDGALLLSPLTGKSENMVNALIRRWFKISNVPVPSQAQLTQVKSTVIDAAKDANPLLHLSGHQLRRYHDRLYLLREMQDISHWQGVLAPHQALKLPDELGQLQLIEPDGSGLLMRAPAADERITVSFNPEGLFARPLGRQGKRKLKKLFQEYGVPSWNRRRTPIIFYNSELAAVVGLFVCQGFEGNELALSLLKD
ncbi:tRNA lysidine(34) synthetase TilS [Veronia nyctiphanis]|uniref:tRNA(Ile)-lysidine synthase n=1 Tax=Veronia nyctiphanis TaxID=1278244 RepID=A0A4Q0YNH4_9GAMM|nr:tRNA lysidine(34) synthetase TilS [Veronia nyctiphanis]RXJ72500.1 tRNA lysidine(34) synthetase TilS [Veronia nyctiphanis]